MGAPADNENKQPEGAQQADTSSTGAAGAQPAAAAADQAAAAATTGSADAGAATTGGTTAAGQSAGSETKTVSEKASEGKEVAEAAEAPEAAASTTAGTTAAAASAAQAEPPKPASTGPFTKLDKYKLSTDIPAGHVGLQVQSGTAKYEVQYYGWDPANEEQRAAAEAGVADMKKGTYNLTMMENITFGGTGQVATGLQHTANARYVLAKPLAGG